MQHIKIGRLHVFGSVNKTIRLYYQVLCKCEPLYPGAADPGGQGGQLPTQYLRESPLGGKNYVEKTIFLSPIKNFLPTQSKIRSAAPDYSSSVFWWYHSQIM